MKKEIYRRIQFLDAVKFYLNNERANKLYYYPSLKIFCCDNQLDESRLNDVEFVHSKI